MLSMSDFMVGPGVAQALLENQDEARSDERYLILEEGNRISLTFGRDATYYWYELDNRVNRAPFVGKFQRWSRVTTHG
jgi:hypothetical protein